MPKICSWRGIIVKMYWFPKEHRHPHVHVFHNDHTAALRISDGMLLEGKLPLKDLRSAQEWVLAHSEELNEMW